MSRAHFKGASYKRVGTVPRVCERCGKDFLALDFNVRNGKGRFCSLSCARQHEGKNRQRRDAVDRLLSRIDKDVSAPCWEWKGYLCRGYGTFHWTSRKAQPAHRAVYETLVGPIPPGLALDHLCKHTSCVNPAHLDPVTPGENLRRSEAFSTLNARKTHCLRGHLFDRISTRGSRICNQCKQITKRERRLRKATAA